MRRPRKRAEREYCTPPVFAEILGVNPDRILAWIRSGELEAIDLGDRTRPRYRIHRDAMERFLASRKAVPSQHKKPRRKRLQSSDLEEFV